MTHPSFDIMISLLVALATAFVVASGSSERTAEAAWTIGADPRRGRKGVCDASREIGKRLPAAYGCQCFTVREVDTIRRFGGFRLQDPNAGASGARPVLETSRSLRGASSGVEASQVNFPVKPTTSAMSWASSAMVTSVPVP